MDRLREKQELLVKLGALFGPLQRILQRPDQYDEQDRARAVAQFWSESHVLNAEVTAFTLAEQGCNYYVQQAQFWSAVHSVISGLANNNGTLESLVPPAFTKALGAIDAIPIPRSSVILESGTPFTTYCKLRSLCEVDAISDIVWVDPYLASNIFHRMISAVRDGVAVTIVTAEPRATAPKKDKERWAELLDVSRLYANEHGQSVYRLIVHPDSLHDRWIMFDKKRIYTFGGSAKDAGDRQYFTIAPLESSVQNLTQIQVHIDSGKEYFGPSTALHL